jgi:mono/diheme cytochrome c family protein
MPSFSTALSSPELTAVVSYVATLNGISNPTLAGRSSDAPAPPALSSEAALGRDLFFDAVRGFARCATCHEVNGIGISVATPIAKAPADVAALRALATPSVSTATMGSERMPALMVGKTTRGVMFYDLTAPPPVLHTADPAAVETTPGSAWKHSSVIGAYSDSDLTSILAYLRAVVKP